MSFATTQAQRVDELRHDGTRLALTLITRKLPTHALGVLFASVEHQARISGIRCVIDFDERVA